MVQRDRRFTITLLAGLLVTILVIMGTCEVCGVETPPALGIAASAVTGLLAAQVGSQLNKR